MLRGEVRLVDLDPARGAEADKRRLAIIVSNDAANGMAAKLGRGVVTVVPVTSNVERVYPFQVLLPERGQAASEPAPVAVALTVTARPGRRAGNEARTLKPPLRPWYSFSWSRWDDKRDGVRLRQSAKPERNAPPIRRAFLSLV